MLTGVDCCESALEPEPESMSSHVLRTLTDDLFSINHTCDKNNRRANDLLRCRGMGDPIHFLEHFLESRLNYCQMCFTHHHRGRNRDARPITNYPSMTETVNRPVRSGTTTVTVRRVLFTRIILILQSTENVDAHHGVTQGHRRRMLMQLWRELNKPVQDSRSHVPPDAYMCFTIAIRRFPRWPWSNYKVIVRKISKGCADSTAISLHFLPRLSVACEPFR